MHDLCLFAETEVELIVKIQCLKEGLESKGLTVNMSKTNAVL